MRLRTVIRTLSTLWLVLGGCMLVPLLLALAFAEKRGVSAFLLSALLSAALGGLARLLCRGPRQEIGQREGVVLVALAWLSICLLGALPFVLGGATPHWIDGAFESASGFTTTGASIFGDVESLDKSILFWRALSHWLGGMGIIVFAIAVLPMLGVSGMQLFRAETSAIASEKLTPRIAETAKALWKIYAALTLIEVALLRLGGMPLFDAVCHSFATMATGGFSTRNASIADYGPFIQWVVVLFMLLAGVNFALYHRLFHGGRRSVWRNSQLRAYLLILAAFTLFVWAGLYLTGYEPAGPGLRHAAFSVTTIVTCTGFANADFALWPQALQLALFLLMFVGGCAGSTSGSIKVIRIVLLFRHLHHELLRMLQPKAVRPVMIDGRVIPDETMRGVWNFFFAYLAIFLIGSFLLALIIEPSVGAGKSGLVPISALSAVATCMGGIGPGLGLVGPMANYAWMPDAAKLELIAMMLLGRLEIFTLLIIFVPATWRRYS